LNISEVQSNSSGIDLTRVIVKPNGSVHINGECHHINVTNYFAPPIGTPTVSAPKTSSKKKLLKQEILLQQKEAKKASKLLEIQNKKKNSKKKTNAININVEASDEKETMEQLVKKMINDTNKFDITKTRSEQKENAFENITQSEEIQTMLNKMSPGNQEIFKSCCNEYAKKYFKSKRDAYVRTPLSLEAKRVHNSNVRLSKVLKNKIILLLNLLVG
jgi:hypothetical protein